MRRLRYAIGALVPVLWTASLVAQTPTGTIRGKVVDEAQQPLSGVTVSVGARSALTQADGNYVLSGVPAGTDTVRARLLGYSPVARVVTLAAGATIDVNLNMTSQAVGLSEIVVTGYGEQRAGDITGAVTALGTEEFNTGRIVNAAQLIAAKAPGVQVIDNSNEPGGSTTLRIRGATSVNASSEPLYIVDGMPLGTGAGTGLSVGRDALNFINPADIENITVLRDASAAAIYGSNAANGVVIITTKSHGGQGGRTGVRLEYTGTFSGSQITRSPDMLNASQFRTAVQQYAPQNVAQLGSANTDWFGEVTHAAGGQEHNVSLTNVAENMFYRLSLGYLNQDGIVQGTNTERVSLGVNYDQRLFNNDLNVKANIRGSRISDQFTPGGVISNAAQYGPTQPIMDSTSVTGYYEWPGNTLQSPDNPVAILGLATDHGTTWRSLGNIQADYRFRFLPQLRANVNLGYDVSRAERETFSPSDLHSQLKVGTGGSDFNSTPNEQNQVFETYFNYANAMGPGRLDATAGYSYQHFNGRYSTYLAQGLSTDVLGGNGIASATTTQNTLNEQESKLISFFGRVNYNIRDRYLIAASLRHDGSSRFGPDNAWGNFPSLSFGWRLSEEGFLKGMSSLSDLKLRLGWAKTGNQSFGNYLYYSTYRFGDNQAQYQFGTGFVPTIRPDATDPNIKWEATDAYNIGLDWGFSNQRFNGTIDFYRKSTSDLIFRVPVAAGTNLSNFVTTNIGAMRNTGVEFNFSAKLMDGRGERMGWTLNFNAAHNSNELTAINPRAGSSQILTGAVSGGVGTTIQVLQPGYPINSFLVYKQKYDAAGKPVYADVNGDNAINDQDLYEDLNGDGVINQQDLRPFHDPAPKWSFGLSSYHNYKKWDLSFTLRAYLGNYVYNNVASNMGTYSEVTRASPYNLHASVLTTNFATPQYKSDYYVEDASFLRMDNITLGYTLNWNGQPLRIFGTIQNAFTMTGYSGVDPTSGINGIDNNIYPRSRTFTGGVSFRL